VSILTSSPTNAGSYAIFARNVSLVALANGLVGIRGIFLIPIIVKQLGEAPYGIWTQIMLFVALASSVGSLGLGNAVTRFLSHSESKPELRDGLYSAFLLVLSASLLAVLITRAGLWLSSARQGTEGSRVVNLGVWLIPLASLDIVCLSYFTAKRRMKLYSLVSVLKAYGEILLVYALVALGWGLLGAVQATIIVSALTTAALLILILSELGFQIPSFRMAGEYLTYGVPTLAITLSLWLLGFCDRYIIRLFSDDAAVGIYSAAYSLGRTINLLVPPLVMVLNPTVFTLWERNEKARAQDFQTRTLKFFLLLALPASAGVSYLGGPILRLLATAATASKGWIVVALVSLGTVFSGVATIIGQVFLLHKDAKTPGWIWSVAAAANVAANFALVPSLELLGAALAAITSYALALSLMIQVGKQHREHAARFDVRFIAKSLLSCAAMLLALHAISGVVPAGLPGLLSSVATGSVVYLGVIWILRGLGEGEIAFIKNVLKGQLLR